MNEVNQVQLERSGKLDRLLPPTQPKPLYHGTMRERLLVLVAILLLLLFIFLVWPKNNPNQAKISLPAPSAAPKIGQEFEIPLLVSVPQAINAGEFYFSFPTDLLEVERLKKDDSFFQLWITGSPTYSNTDGTISVAGGLPTPGFIGKDGQVVTIVFKAKQAGNATITLDNSRTQLLANDGKGTKVTATFEPLKINIKP